MAACASDAADAVKAEAGEEAICMSSPCLRLELCLNTALCSATRAMDGSNIGGPQDCSRVKDFKELLFENQAVNKIFQESFS